MPGLMKKKLQLLQSPQVPHYFRCPISLELMRDPVTVSTGQTYDRSSIEKWVSDGNVTCPATMQQLSDLTLIPNHTLRRLIQEWCVANRSRGVERIPTPKQPADPRRIQSLLHQVSASGAATQALRTLRSLAKENEKNRVVMAELGLVPVVIAALFRGTDVSENGSENGSEEEDQGESSTLDDVEEASLGVLVLLPMSEAERGTITRSRRRLELLSRMVQRGLSMEARINAAVVIEKIVAASEDESTKLLIGSTPGLFQGLVDLLQEHQAVSPRAPKAGVKALFSLCLCTAPANCDRAVSSGAAAALVEHLPAAQRGDADRTLGTLELLCRTVAGRVAVAGHALAVPALVAALVCRSSVQATECAAGTLLAVCSGSEEVQLAAVEAGVLRQLLLLIQSDCTDRAKRKGVELLKLLRRWWTEDPCLSELERTDVVAF